MKLNLNFDGFTKLRDWWKTVRSNFEIIETECNKTRTIADNACTKEEVRSYINEFIGLSDEYMAVIEAFTELYKENESTVAAMDEIYGGRLKYYSKEDVFDANEAVGEDAIFFCKAETENTPANQTGILISKTDNKQMWIAEDGKIFYRQFADDMWSEWKSLFNDIDDSLALLNEKIESYQKPWDINENVGCICINKLKISLVAPQNKEVTEEVVFVAINSGKVNLRFKCGYNSSYTIEPTISVYINEKVVAEYNNTNIYAYDPDSPSTQLIITPIIVNKGDRIRVIASGKGSTYSSSGKIIVEEIELFANIDTPYKYIDLNP